jgi:hypothetical protein
MLIGVIWKWLEFDIFILILLREKYLVSDTFILFLPIWRAWLVQVALKDISLRATDELAVELSGVW